MATVFAGVALFWVGAIVGIVTVAPDAHIGGARNIVIALAVFIASCTGVLGRVTHTISAVVFKNTFALTAKVIGTAEIIIAVCIFFTVPANKTVSGFNTNGVVFVVSAGIGARETIAADTSLLSGANRAIIAIGMAAATA